jgi:flagellar motor switch/type III secretory pathway protein FliN
MERTMTGIELATRSVKDVKTTGSNLARIDPDVPWMMRIEEHPSWQVLAQLRVTLRVGVALSRFKVRDLLKLQEGQVFETLAPATEDVPLKVGQVQLGWSEFEVLQQRMALRLTRLG